MGCVRGRGEGYKTQTTGVGLGEVVSLGPEAGGSVAVVVVVVVVVVSCEVMVGCCNLSFCVGVRVERQGKARRGKVERGRTELYL